MKSTMNNMKDSKREAMPNRDGLLGNKNGKHKEKIIVIYKLKNDSLENKQKEFESKVKALNSRKNAIKKIRYFCNNIRLKQSILLILAFVLVIVIIGITGLLLGIVPDFVNCCKAEMPDLIDKMINAVSNINKGKSVILLLWLILLILLYSLYLITKYYRRNQNVLHKLRILIMRLKLYSDKDLINPSRLDRELEMIYRILES